MSLDAFGLTLGVLWRSLGASWEPLCSHLMPLGDFRELSGRFWCPWAPLWEVLEAPWVDFEITWCHFEYLGHLKCRLRAIGLT